MTQSRNDNLHPWEELYGWDGSNFQDAEGPRRVRFCKLDVLINNTGVFITGTRRALSSDLAGLTTELEIRVGQSNQLYWMWRIAPGLI